MRRRLRDLTLATNAGRDSEVQLAMVAPTWRAARTGRDRGLAWLLGRLEERQLDARAKVTTGVAARFVKLATKLRPRLETVQLVVRTGRGQPLLFSDVTRELSLKYVERLGERLKAVRDGETVVEAHAARIAAKRLRYLWEPLSRRVPRARALVGRLKQLQDVLGEVHDMQVLSEEIASSLAAHQKAVSASGTPSGLRALRRIAQEQAGLSFTSFQAQWSNGRAAGFLSPRGRSGPKSGVRRSGQGRLFLFPGSGSSAKSSLVDSRLTDLSELLVCRFLLPEVLPQQLLGLGVTQERGVGTEAAIGGDLVMLHPLG